MWATQNTHFEQYTLLTPISYTFQSIISWICLSDNGQLPVSHDSAQGHSRCQGHSSSYAAIVELPDWNAELWPGKILSYIGNDLSHFEIFSNNSIMGLD